MPVKILMVCLGNICRSPLAEGIMASKLPKDKFSVDSAGTGSWHIGHAPDSRSIATAKKNKLDISNQKGRQFSSTDFETYDYIYVMDKSNYDNVIELAQTPEQKNKVQIILNELYPNENVDVPDPYFGMPNGFDIVYNMLNEVCDIIANKLKETHL
ncbi:low molecular weight protein-tyrosine-phosphatase [Flavobacterium frigoris]|uniref:protein-tyrosine-phosphatase n=1 Tax=Flavobacterium frigoris (strain PS1) TaxID=1086011 RepID=H7FRD6_FLAFP|nr:low molecular weight protein-tyrosine-phosphatase [Flavobacterium frigoris]EIA08919.1 low molecular weight protein tyrosine phosphatase [Flavobacterium frigoris PS1]